MRATWHPGNWSGVGRGIGFMLLATITSTIVTASVKQLSTGYSPVQILFFRCTIALMVFLAWTRYRNITLNYRSPHRKAHVLRGLIAVFSIGLFIVSLPHVPLFDATALSFSQPLFIAALSAPILGERVGLHRWIAIVVGFLATLLMLRPDFSSGQIWFELLVILSSLLWALSLLLNRRLSFVEGSHTIVFFFLLTGAFFTSLATPFVWKWPTPEDWSILLLLGVISVFSQLWTTEAYRYAPAAVVSPYFYATLLWTVIIGYAIWGEIPGILVIAGSLLLVAAGIYLALMERRGGNKQEKASGAS